MKSGKRARPAPAVSSQDAARPGTVRRQPPFNPKSKIQNPKSEGRSASAPAVSFRDTAVPRTTPRQPPFNPKSKIQNPKCRNWSALSRSPAQTEQIAARFAKRLRAGNLLLLTGTYGAGKTCFVRGLCAGLGGDPAQVSSPTFVLLNVYRARRPLYHYDVVRLRNPHETIEMVLEQTPPEAIAAVEWGERVEGVDNLQRWEIHIAWAGKESRKIVAVLHKPIWHNRLRGRVKSRRPRIV